MKAQVPDPVKERDAFHGWALLYLERGLTLEQEKAFEVIVATSSEAANALVRAAEIDTALHERGMTLALERGPNAKPLNPENPGDMQFVALICSQIRGEVVQRIGPAAHASKRSSRERATRRLWLPAVAAAGMLLAVCAYWLALNPTLPGNVARGPQPPTPGTQAPVPADSPPTPENPDQRPPSPPVLARQETQKSNEAPPPKSELPPEELRVVVSPTGKPQPAPELLSSKEPEHEFTAVPSQPWPQDEEKVIFTQVFPNEDSFTSAAWRYSGNEKLVDLSQPAQVTLKLQSANPDVPERSGLVYRRAFALSQGKPAIRLTVSGPLFTSKLHNLEFLVTNKSDGGDLVALPVKSEHLQPALDNINPARTKHTLELIVWRDRYQVNIDDQTLYFECKELDHRSWDEVYLGFRAISRNTAEGQVLMIDGVSVALQKQRKK